jgi:amidase
MATQGRYALHPREAARQRQSRHRQRRAEGTDQQGHPGTPHRLGRRLTEDGLPISVQIIGPYLNDRTTIAFAELVEREFGGFVRPPNL